MTPHESHLKEELLALSDVLVDLIERLEKAVEENDESLATATVHELNKVGESLVAYLNQTKDDDLAYVNFMMGSLCSALRMWPQAEKAYLDALAHWPDHIGIMNELALALVELNKPSDAVTWLKKSITIGGETPDVAYNLAAALAQSGELQQAKISLFTSMAKFPEDNGLRHLLYQLDNEKTA